MCGIAAFLPKNDNKPIVSVMLSLALGNEERGADNCGISVGKWILRGGSGSGRFRSLYINNMDKILDHLSRSEPIIIHNRRSNKFIGNLECSHPFHFYKGEEDNKVSIIGCHNGVITNEDELYKKFCGETDKSILKIDSQYILCSLLMSDHEEVLKEYNGDAALIFYTDDKFYVWKGAKYTTEERPMHYVETDHGWYFASTSENLRYAFGIVGIPVVPTSVENNNLMIFTKKGVHIENKVINRTYTTTRTAYNQSCFLPSASTSQNVFDTFITDDGYCVDVNGNYIHGKYFAFSTSSSWLRKTKDYVNLIEVEFFHGIQTTDIAKLKQVLNLVKGSAALHTVIEKHKQLIRDCIVDYIPVKKKKVNWCIYVTKNKNIDYKRYDTPGTYKPKKYLRPVEPDDSEFLDFVDAVDSYDNYEYRYKKFYNNYG